MKRNIYFWHGREKSVVAKIAAFCDYDSQIDQYSFDGTLDDFAQHFDNFMVLGDIIAVTQHKNFSQRG